MDGNKDALICRAVGWTKRGDPSRPTHDVLAKGDGSVSRGGRWTVGASDWQVLTVECLYCRKREMVGWVAGALVHQGQSIHDRCCLRCVSLLSPIFFIYAVHVLLCLVTTVSRFLMLEATTQKMDTIVIHVLRFYFATLADTMENTSKTGHTILRIKKDRCDYTE